ncbi:hypothetical protein [Thermococcus sp.]|uniref:hypothetical protein n=1 Tax=Thermococcus sp. TaxID=35749 RepID=UPI00262A2DDC|nr:hypothetical protein [Thermococcus sp.]
MGKEEKVKVVECGDGWERFSRSISSLSLSLLPTLLFTLIMAYVIVVGLENANFTLTVNGQEVNFSFPEIEVPIDYAAIRNAVLYLFGAVLIGLPVPLLSGKLKPLKVLITLIQAGAFVYGLYIFVMVIVNFAVSLM